MGRQGVAFGVETVKVLREAAKGPKQKREHNPIYSLGTSGTLTTANI
jgi:hypothetical protein